MPRKYHTLASLTGLPGVTNPDLAKSKRMIHREWEQMVVCRMLVGRWPQDPRDKLAKAIFKSRNQISLLLAFDIVTYC